MLPPLVGDAVNVTIVPKQILPGEEAILTEGVTVVFITVIVMVLEVTVLTVAQAAFDVMKAVTISPFANELVVYNEEFVPTLMPFTCH